MKQQDSRRYPIGKFAYGKSYTFDETRKNIKILARLPKDLKRMLRKLDSDEINLSYREGGWTVRQIIHHLADSHINAYVRMKLAVTEPTPIIKPYEEQLWAETEDGKHGGIKMSFRLLTALHRRWVAFLESLNEDDLERGYFHPANQRMVMLPEAIALYAWHSRHHLEHIRIVASGQGVEATLMAAVSMPAPSTAAEVRGSRRPAPVQQPVEATVTRRKRRTKEEIAADKAAAAARPKMSRSEALAVARQRRMEKRAAEGKTSPTTQVQPAATTGKRARRTKDQIAADNAAKASQPKMTRAEALAKARAMRAANRSMESQPAKATTAAGTSKVNSGARMTTEESLARVRAERAAARAAKHLAANGTAQPATPTVQSSEERPKRTYRTKEQVAAEKMAKAAQPKLSRSEILAKARAARQNNIAARQENEPASVAIQTKPADTPKRTRRTPEQIAADKAAQAARPKMTPAQALALARERRMANRAAEGKTTKAPASNDGPKMTRAEALAKARATRAARAAEKVAPVSERPKKGQQRTSAAASKNESTEEPTGKRRGMSPEHMARIREMRSQKAEATATAKPKQAKPAQADAEGEPTKRRGMSAEHMARIREMRTAKQAGADKKK